MKIGHYCESWHDVKTNKALEWGPLQVAVHQGLWSLVSKSLCQYLSYLDGSYYCSLNNIKYAICLRFKSRQVGDRSCKAKTPLPQYSHVMYYHLTHKCSINSCCISSIGLFPLYCGGWFLVLRSDASNSDDYFELQTKHVFSVFSPQWSLIKWIIRLVCNSK